MKIVRIGEGGKINPNKDVSETSKSKNTETSSRGVDEIVIKLKSKEFPEMIKNEMIVIQREVTITQAQIDAISKVSKLLKGITTYDENIKSQIQQLYETSKYEDMYLLENIKDELFSGDLNRLLSALEKEVNNLSSKVEENRKKTNALLVKFQNINTFIDTISNEQVDTTAKLITSSITRVQKILNITPYNVMKFLSN
ncbi:MAG: hypothetical protein ABDH28_05605 [Brevinematia bacterium]